MAKSKTLSTLDGQNINILHEGNYESLVTVLRANRGIVDEDFFTPSIDGLHDPFLMPDMDRAVDRILRAQSAQERVVIFGDYDVDGVSSTAILFRFFREIGIECSYRLPHRVHDGYGLKKYFFDDLASKNVKVVITVDCGTRDIEAIDYARSLGIDVIVTDHHAVPEVIPEGVPILNPKRRDSKYPFSSLAGAGVAFKLLHALAIRMTNSQDEKEKTSARNELNTILTSYIDLASLGTVADCMPLIGENRIITALGLRQMKESESSALRTYITNLDRDIEGDADVIGFQIGPRINAAGRMDSPLKALHWLLASEETVDDWLLEIESLNSARQEAVKRFSEDALMSVDTTEPILFYSHDELEHGLIGLIAGKITEAYGKPAIVLCNQHKEGNMKRDVENSRREYEQFENSGTGRANDELVASCRSPDWCHLVELLDLSREFFVRYGGHRQAAGFTIESEKFEGFKEHILGVFAEKYDITDLPKKAVTVECSLNPSEVTLETLDTIDRFRPFGIGNTRPLFLIEDLTVDTAKIIGKEGDHLALTFREMGGVKSLLWNYRELFGENPTGKVSPPAIGDILSIVGSLERNLWNGKSSIQFMIKNISL